MVKTVIQTALVALLASTAHIHADDGSIKIGVLNDQSTSFSALGGTEVVRAVEMAVQDYGGSALGKPVEVIFADHQNKPEVALSIARQWLSQDNVDAIVDVANSSVALGVNTLLGENKKIGLFVSPLTDRPTEADCNGYIVAWAYDIHSTVGTVVQGLLAEGHKSFFVLSNDYEAGKAQEAWVEESVLKAGGEIKDKIRVPLNTTDFSSYILRAQASGAEVIVMNVGGADLVNAMKQVHEFGLIDAGQKVAVTFLHQSDARALGVDALKGVRFSAPWFWGKDEASRDFGKRMMEVTGNAPGWIAAGNYSVVSAYLKAVDEAGTDNAEQVLETLKQSDVDDFFVGNGTFYPSGRLIHDMYLLEVKAANEVTEKDDFFELVATVPAEQAFRPYAESACKL